MRELAAAWPARISPSLPGLGRLLSGHRGALAAAAAILLGATGLDLLVRMQAEALVERELLVVAERTLAAAEASLAAAEGTLSDLVRAGTVSCAAGSVDAFRVRLRDVPVIADLSVVDAEGWLMCSARTEANGPVRLLPPAEAGSGQLLLQPDRRPNHDGLLVAWTLTGGGRLTAELAPNPQDAPAPAFLDGRHRLSLQTAAGLVWRTEGPLPAAEIGTDRAIAVSRTWPLLARIVAPDGFIPSSFQIIRAGIWGAAGAALAIVGWAVWRRRQAAARAESAALGDTGALYLPVVEIGTGRIIGMDLIHDAFRPGRHSVGAGLAAAASMLRSDPRLKLSIPVRADAPGLDRLIGDLPALLAEASVLPEQVVLTLTSGLDGGARADTLLGRLRMAGLHVSLDHHALVGAGGLVALLKHRPDFVSIDARNEDEDVIVQALVGMARDLGIGVVARNVGDSQRLTDFRKAGILSASGPAFGAPVSAPLMAELVAAAPAS